MDDDEIEITIDGKLWLAFSEFELSMGLDSYTACSFTAPFDYGREEIRELFRPFRYRPVTVSIGGQLMMTGQMVGIAPNATASVHEVQIACYAKPAQLLDNDPPPDLLPLELNNYNLRQILGYFAGPFGIEIDAPSDTGAAFERVKCEPDKKIQEFLVDLCKQRGFVLTDTPDGKLLVTKSTPTGRPVQHLEGQPMNKVTPTFNPQEYFSQITGFGKKKSGRSGSKHTVQNSLFLGSNIRTNSFMLDDADDADVPFAVKSQLGRMFGNLVSYVIEDLPTWRTDRGVLWDRNTTITLAAPGAMVYGDVELLVRNVVFKRNAEAKTATLGVVLPGAFSGEEPDRFPWEEEN